MALSSYLLHIMCYFFLPQTLVNKGNRKNASSLYICFTFLKNNFEKRLFTMFFNDEILQFLRILSEVLEANKLPGAICSLVQGGSDVGYDTPCYYLYSLNLSSLYCCVLLHLIYLWFILLPCWFTFVNFRFQGSHGNRQEY